MAEPLFIFVVYDRPTDFPNEIVVRKFTAVSGVPEPLEIIYRGLNLLDAQSKILELSPHAIQFHRDPSDESQIVECWI